jgi:enamine deaminase RidA (YjgF/YER057c/UK114 family)
VTSSENAPKSLGKIDARLAELGLELPEPPTPGANYVPCVKTGSLLFVTGQLSQWNGERRYIGNSGESSTSKRDNAQRSSAH